MSQKHFDPRSVAIRPADDLTAWMDEGPTQPLGDPGTLGIDTMECVLGSEKPLEGDTFDLAELHDELFRAADRITLG